MKLKERKWETCSKCGKHTKLIGEDSYGCDECKKPIDDLLNSGNTKYANYLELTVFFTKGGTTRYQFCSWRCVFKFLRKVKTDYFVSLPHLIYMKTPKGQTVKDFSKYIRLGK